MIGQVIEVADKVLGKFIPDKNLKMKLEHIAWNIIGMKKINNGI